MNCADSMFEHQALRKAQPADRTPPADLVWPARLAPVLQWLSQRVDTRAAMRSDSRMVQPGDLFFALPGLQSAAQRYVSDALERGAGAVLLADDAAHSHRSVFAWSGLANHAGELAAAFAAYPSRKLSVVAVTGTNGKTTVSHWMAQAWSQTAAVIGTLGAGLIDSDQPLESFGLTTPDAVRLQQMLRDFLAQGTSLVAMEASSIGLHQGRLQGLEPAVAVFTNLSRDHLDYHANMQAYAEAKAQLFAMLTPGRSQAVVNADDAWAGTMIGACPAGCPLWLFSLQEQADEAQALAARHRAHLLWADYRADDQASQVQWALFAPGNPKAIHQGHKKLALMGRFNAANALAVACSLMALGQSPSEAMQALDRLKAVPGRMQCLGQSQTPLVVVDYAHTPDAIEQVLVALRPVAQQRQGRLHCVLGAGGDRDPGKREAMGAAAMGIADSLCLTSDNPRYEDPEAICEALKKGASGVAGLARDSKRLFVELDRGLAIDRVIQQAGPRDVILIAGKGHERFQEIQGQRISFDDESRAREALQLHWPLQVQA